MQNVHQPLRIYLILTVMAFAVGEVQASPSPSGVNHLYAACVVCHQPNAWGSPDGFIPNLAGQQVRYLAKQLAVFQSGARVDWPMQAVSAHETVGKEQTRLALATYLSSLQPVPSPVTGSGEHLRVGQELYAHICAACHGADGNGQRQNAVPRIAGQHYPYLQRQIDVAAALHRDLAPPEMTSALRGMPAQEKAALADYISRLGNSEVLLDSNGRAAPEFFQPAAAR